MDANVLAAMARWPNVPDVYGWLSLTESGQWRLHTRGEGSAGESITSPQILQFIDRNYACDKQGQWFFQNGPQKVYVRLDAAPYILQTIGDSLADGLVLRTHNGLDVRAISAWWLDDAGKLYAQTEHGPGLVAGRDLTTVLDGIHTPEGVGILDVLEGEAWRDGAVEVAVSNYVRASDYVKVSDYAPLALIRPTGATVLFKSCIAAAVPRTLGFVQQPGPQRADSATHKK